MAILNSSVINGGLSVTDSISENGVPLLSKYFAVPTTAGTYFAKRNSDGTITYTNAATSLKGTYDSSTGILTITSI